MLPSSDQVAGHKWSCQFVASKLFRLPLPWISSRPFGCTGLGAVGGLSYRCPCISAETAGLVFVKLDTFTPHSLETARVRFCPTACRAQTRATAALRAMGALNAGGRMHSPAKTWISAHGRGLVRCTSSLAGYALLLTPDLPRLATYRWLAPAGRLRDLALALA